MLPSLAILNILTDAAAASAAAIPTRVRVPELQHEHEVVLEVRGDGDFKLCPAAHADDSPPLFLIVVIFAC